MSIYGNQKLYLFSTVIISLIMTIFLLTCGFKLSKAYQTNYYDAKIFDKLTYNIIDSDIIRLLIEYTDKHGKKHETEIFDKFVTNYQIGDTIKIFVDPYDEKNISLTPFCINKTIIQLIIGVIFLFILIIQSYKLIKITCSVPLSNTYQIRSRFLRR